MTMTRKDESETAFVFDVDGTLVASSLQLSNENRETLLRFSEAMPTYLISGSEFEKTRWRIGDLVFKPVRGVFNCNGNSFRVGGLPVFQSSFDLTGEQAAFLQDLLAGSGFPLRTGRHIDRRAGLVNFSVVGRNADLSERRQYVAWNQAKGERKGIAELINRQFGDIVSAQVAGETGIDLVEPGKDKGRVYRFLKDPFHCLRTGYAHAGFARIAFFGDNCHPGGNDYPLAMRLDQRVDTCHKVTSIGDTYRTLNRILSDAAWPGQFGKQAELPTGFRTRGISVGEAGAAEGRFSMPPQPVDAPDAQSCLVVPLITDCRAHATRPAHAQTCPVSDMKAAKR